MKLNACLTLIGGGLRKDHGFPNCLCKLALQKTIGLQSVVVEMML